MKARVTPYYVDLVYEACLKSFWRKKALARFLFQCGVGDTAIASWAPEETKRDLLDRIFCKLPQSEDGRKLILKVSQQLMEQRSFPDLKNWEESAAMIKEAHDAVSKLRIHHAKQEEEIQSEEARRKAKEEFRAKQEQACRSQKTLASLSDRLNEISQRLGTQQAGYDFQDWFYDLLDFAEISNRKPYVHGGRQIDGSLTLSGTTYLAELKFTAGQSDANDIDSFYRKVASKADNTMGIMVSISGYSSVAIKEASGERTPLLLMDHGHIYLALCGMMGFGDIIDRVRRHASQTGEAYLPAADFGGK